MRNIRIAFLFVLLVCSKNISKAQSTFAPLLTADSLASGNYKDVLTSFFQFSLNNLADTNREISFTSNLFAYMLRHNPSLDIDTNYVRYKLARNTNIDLNIKLNDDKQFNGFSFGFRYAIFNRRDYTVSKEFLSLAMAKNKDLYILHDSLVAKRSTLTGNDRKRYREQTDKLFNDSSFTLSSLDPDVRQFVIKAAESSQLKHVLYLLRHNPDVSLYRYGQESYEEVKKSFQNKPIWTMGLNMLSYDDRFQAQTLSLSSEFLKGVMNPDKLSNIEMAIRGEIAVGNDTTQLSRNLDRCSLSWEGGLNWVMKGWASDQSFMEFEVSASQNVILRGIYSGEEYSQFNLNGTLRFRVSNNLWIPVTFKYDPVSNNTFGYVNIISNFTGLK